MGVFGEFLVDFCYERYNTLACVRSILCQKGNSVAMGNKPGVFKSEEEKETDHRRCPLIFADSQYTALGGFEPKFYGSDSPGHSDEKRASRTKTLAFGFPFWQRIERTHARVL